MEPAFAIFKALKNCATRYNDKDITEWMEKTSFVRMSVDIMDELNSMGYALVETNIPLQGTETELVTDDGE
jgi:hypothetical protein